MLTSTISSRSNFQTFNEDPQELSSTYAIHYKSEGKSYSTIWVSMCLLKLEECLKHLKHTVHSKGFSPVWVRTCSRQLFFHFVVYGQKWHWCHNPEPRLLDSPCCIPLKRIIWLQSNNHTIAAYTHYLSTSQNKMDFVDMSNHTAITFWIFS